MRTPLTGIYKPKWELYDIHDNREHNLFQSYIMEFNDIAGIKIGYHVRDADFEDYDTLYGEHQYYGFEVVKNTKCLYDVEDEPEMWNVFGSFGADTVTTHMPKGTYRRDVSQTIEPKIGDVLTTEWNERSYEIIMVDDDERIFQLKHMIWIFILKPYRFSEQSTTASALSDTPAISAAGENAWIQEQSEEIDDYSDVDTSVYGF